MKHHTYAQCMHAAANLIETKNTIITTSHKSRNQEITATIADMLSNSSCNYSINIKENTIKSVENKNGWIKIMSISMYESRHRQGDFQGLRNLTFLNTYE